MQSLPEKLKKVSIIDDTEEAYYKHKGYDASLYQTLADTFDESEETELGVVPGESCNENNNVVPTVEIHETVPDEQTSADPFNSRSTGYIEHITTEQGGVSQIYKEYNSLKEMPGNINDVNQRLKYHCSMQSPPKGLMKAEHLQISLCKCSKELLANLKESMNLLHLAIKDCSQHHVKRFPTNFNELANLKTLSIRCIHIESLPSFAGLCSLLKLYISAPRLEKLPANLDNLDKLLVVDIHDTKIKCLPWSIKNLQKLRFLNLPLDFRLETLSCQLIESVVITVDCMHIRKSWKELKTGMGLLSFRGVGVDEGDNFSTITSSGYLPLKEDPGLWIMENYDLCVSVRSLELELPVNVPIGDSIGELPKLTYLYISGNINLDLKHLSGISKTLRHLSLQHCNNEFLSTSLRKLSNLEFLCLDLGDSNLPSNLDLLVNLKHLSLRHGSKHSDINSLARLSNLRALDLFQCYLESLPANLKLAELKLSGSIIKSLPTSLHRLEILHDKGSCENRECDVASFNLKQLINIEKLSVTCYSMMLLPSIERLQNLQELQLKDCSSLEALPNYLEKLVKLCTLDISGTRIKSLPDSFTKLSNLEHLILPKCFQQDSSLKYPNKGFINVTIDDIVELYFNDMSSDDDGYETSMEISDEGNGTDLDCIEGHNEAISKELEEGSINVQTSPHKVHAIPILEDFCSSRSETPNPEGESIPAIQNDQNDITTMLIEQDNGENSHHDLENGQKQVPQHNKVKRNKRTEISEKKLNQCWSENPMSLQETAEKIFGVSRSTMKRRLKELKLVWPSRKKGKQHLDDAKKRKHNSKAPFGSDSTQQNLVIPTNSTAQAKIVGGRITGANQLTLPNHVSSNSDVVGNLAPDTIVESVRGNLMDTQGNMDSQHGEEHYLDGANDQGHLEGVLHSTESNRAATLEETSDPMVIESHMGIQQQVQGHLEGALHTTESSGTIVVKATYKELSVRIVFSLTLPISQLIEEIGMKFQLELNKYRLLYQDADKEWMMLTSVEDLKYASNVAESLGTKFVRLSVIDYVV